MKNKFKSLFAKKNDSEEVTAPDNAATDVTDAAEATEADETLDIEKDARKFYNDNHQKEIDERIRSLHEKAMSTFAKDDVVPQETTGEVPDEPAEDDNVILAEEAAEESAAEAPTEVSDETVSEEAETEAEEEAETDENPENGKTRNYDMTQLLKILKPGTQDTDGEKNSDDDVADAFYSDDDIDDYAEDDDTNTYPHDFEYTDPVQTASMFASFRKNAVASSIAMLLTLVFTLLCVWLECGNASGLPFAEVMTPGHYGRVYAMVSLQMLGFCVFFNASGLARGISKLSLRKPAPESVAVLTTALCVIHTVGTAVSAYKSPSYRTFCFAGCFVLLLLSINTFIKSYSMFKSFAMVASKRNKLAITELDSLSRENAVFAKYLDEDSKVVSVAETASVSDFVKTEYTIPKAHKSVNVLLYFVLIACTVIALARIFVMGTPVYQTLTDALAVFLVSAPVGFLTATAIPYFSAGVRASKGHSAIVGESAPDFLENVTVLSFDDVEVFPPKAVKITGIKTYNDNRIDKVILYMAKIFNKLGGPLSYVFSNSIQGAIDDSTPVKLIENNADGLHLAVGDDDILLGKSAYLRMFDIEAPIDDSDETELRSLTGILYLVCNGKPAAKFYIRYGLNRRFEEVFKGLYNAGICCGIKTSDPAIDDGLVLGLMRVSNAPVGVVRKELSEISAVAETAKAPVLCVSSIHNFLKGFIIADNLSGKYRTATVFATVASILGLVAATASVFLGSGVSSGLLVAYHLVWMLPTLALSLLSK